MYTNFIFKHIWIPGKNFQHVRLAHRMRGKPPTIARSLYERIEELNRKDPLYCERLDIGFPRVRAAKDELGKYTEHIRRLKNDNTLEKLARDQNLLIDTRQVRCDWLSTLGPSHIKKIADHYKIFEHLYKEGYFIPRLEIKVAYSLEDNSYLPVYYGNDIKPSEAKAVPTITYEAQENSLWTLVLTSLDGHLTESKEYVHWFLSNIRGNKISSGTVNVEYMQPIPPRGTGFHRYVYVLYKQNKEITYDLLVRGTNMLDSRTFVTYDWYSKYQDFITPCGIAFFQTSWDESVKDFFHKSLSMKEPVYEYDFPAPYIRPQEWFPLRKPFNIYMDKYRDQKDVNKEYFLRKLKDTHPFKRAEKLKFPNAHPLPIKMPSWLKTKETRIRLKQGRINEVL